MSKNVSIGNIQAESSILGNIIEDISLIEFVKSEGEVLFQYPKHKKLYNIIADMYSNGDEVNLLTVISKSNNVISMTDITNIHSGAIRSEFNGAISLAKNELTKLNTLKFRESISIDDTPETISDKLELLQHKDKTFEFESGTDLLQNVLGDIEALYASGKKKYISTGFPHLDKKLGGGLYAGLYVVGAGSSIGKTTFVQQIADNIAASGKKVLFFSLEMGKKEMISKTIVRELFQKEESTLGTRQLLNGDLSSQDWTRLANASGPINNIVRNTFYIEGNFGTTVNEIINKTRLFKSKYKEVPVIVVDYLQIIAPNDIRMNDKQTVDRNIAELKRLSRDLDTPVLTISSVNRQNYLSYIDFSAFKESGKLVA